MKSFSLTIIFLVWIHSIGFTQKDSLTFESLEIKTAYENLQKDTISKDLQRKYIEVFPENAKIFKEVFQSPNFEQLYSESYSYVLQFYKLSQYYPDLVGNKLIKLCIGLKKWDVDAITYIQISTITFANSNYAVFIRLIKKLNEQDLNNLILFLADVENHSSYTIYSNFMDKLSMNNESELLRKFKRAKELRINYKNH